MAVSLWCFHQDVKICLYRQALGLGFFFNFLLVAVFVNIYFDLISLPSVFMYFEITFVVVLTLTSRLHRVILALEVANK